MVATRYSVQETSTGGSNLRNRKQADWFIEEVKYIFRLNAVSHLP